MIDYEKLANDLIKARKAAEQSVIGEDGGSANRDYLTLKLKGYREDKTLEIIRKSGLSGFKAEWIGQRYFICPPKGAMGNDRVRQVEAMYKVMSEAGYDALMYQQMD